MDIKNVNGDVIHTTKGADLRGANLVGAKLVSANLVGAWRG